MKSTAKWSLGRLLRFTVGHFLLGLSLRILPDDEWEKIFEIIWGEMTREDIEKER